MFWILLVCSQFFLLLFSICIHQYTCIGIHTMHGYASSKRLDFGYPLCFMCVNNLCVLRSITMYCKHMIRHFIVLINEILDFSWISLFFFGVFFSFVLFSDSILFCCFSKRSSRGFRIAVDFVVFSFYKLSFWRV